MKWKMREVPYRIHNDLIKVSARIAALIDLHLPAVGTLNAEATSRNKCVKIPRRAILNRLFRMPAKYKAMLHFRVFQYAIAMRYCTLLRDI